MTRSRLELEQLTKDKENERKTMEKDMASLQEQLQKAKNETAQVE